MKTFLILKNIVLVLSLSSSILLNAQTEKLLFTPEIKYDNAILLGKITGMIPPDSVFKPIHLRFNNAVTADKVSYDIPVKKDGTFYLSIPVQSISFIVLESENSEYILCLIPGEETRMEISYEGDLKKLVKLSNSLGFTADDAMNLQEVLEEAITQATGSGKSEVVAPEIFSRQSINSLTKCMVLINNTERLSGVAKQIAISELKSWWISSYLFDYVMWTKIDYMNQYKVDSVPNEFHPQIPGKSYYSFLKTLKIYDPVNFSASFYSTFLQLLLKNDTLGIPAIGEMPVDTWMIKTQKILKDYIGTDTGQFYDLLAGNAFAKQLNVMQPLSEIQKNNIKSHFINKSIVSILMDENEKVIHLAAQNKNANIYEIDKSSDSIMDSIVSKYKGKVVFIDFWATWCLPCLKAMRESESVRKEFENKDVVFVYVTDASSPRKTWEQKAAEIHGEQYYLTEEEMNTINKIYNFTAIPHYLIYDKNGVMQYNYGPFMGNENMKKWIDESL